MTDDSKKKTQFRRTAKWKKFRAYMKKECKGLDFITGKKLYKGFQLHHKDMRLENYKNLVPGRFLCCNKKTHEVVHWCYEYYKTDKEFIDRLKFILDEMCEYNTDILI